MTPVAAHARRFPVLDVARVRADFPILQRQARGRPLVYLDNAATTQKPQVVIDAITRYYTDYNANVHRGVHELSELRERGVRGRAAQGRARFSTPRTNARSSSRATRPRASTSSRMPSARTHVGAGDEVLISAMEHHSNIVPWQLLCEERGRAAARGADRRSRRADARRIRGAGGRRGRRSSP